MKQPASSMTAAERQRYRDAKRAMFAWVKETAVENHTQRSVLTALAEFADIDRRSFHGQDSIAKRVACSVRTIRRTLDALERLKRIKRSHRYDKRGRRTSDNIYLLVEPLPDNLAGSDDQTTGQSDPDYRPNCPSLPAILSPESNREPTVESSPVAQLRGSGGDRTDSADLKDAFWVLWNDWPKEDRPNHRRAAKSAWQRLRGTDERKKALLASAFYLRAMRRRKERPLMISYLDDGLFDEFFEAPPIDEDGDFVITSDREEWIPWIDQLRRDHGEAGVTSTMKLQGGPRIVRRQRWPGNEASSPAQEQRAQGGSTR